MWVFCLLLSIFDRTPSSEHNLFLNICHWFLQSWLIFPFLQIMTKCHFYILLLNLFYLLTFFKLLTFINLTNLLHFLLIHIYLHIHWFRKFIRVLSFRSLATLICLTGNTRFGYFTLRGSNPNLRELLKILSSWETPFSA